MQEHSDRDDGILFNPSVTMRTSLEDCFRVLIDQPPINQLPYENTILQTLPLSLNWPTSIVLLLIESDPWVLAVVFM